MKREKGRERKGEKGRERKRKRRAQHSSAPKLEGGENLYALDFVDLSKYFSSPIYSFYQFQFSVTLCILFVSLFLSVSVSEACASLVSFICIIFCDPLGFFGLSFILMMLLTLTWPQVRVLHFFTLILVLPHF